MDNRQEKKPERQRAPRPYYGHDTSLDPRSWKSPANGNIYAIPLGYERIKWQDVENGQRVYVLGIKDGHGHAYGPHTVYKKDYNQLQGAGLKHFWEPLETLLIPDRREARR